MRAFEPFPNCQCRSRKGRYNHQGYRLTIQDFATPVAYDGSDELIRSPLERKAQVKPAGAFCCVNRKFGTHRFDCGDFSGIVSDCLFSRLSLYYRVITHRTKIHLHSRQPAALEALQESLARRSFHLYTLFFVDATHALYKNLVFHAAAVPIIISDCG